MLLFFFSRGTKILMGAAGAVAILLFLLFPLAHCLAKA
jgi:hypothetical protein